MRRKSWGREIILCEGDVSYWITWMVEIGEVRGNKRKEVKAGGVPDRHPHNFCDMAKLFPTFQLKISYYTIQSKYAFFKKTKIDPILIDCCY